MTNFEKITGTTASLARTIVGSRHMGVGYMLEGLEDELTKTEICSLPINTTIC